MRRFSLLFALLAVVRTASAADISSEQGSSFVIGITLFILLAAMVVHMVMDNFFKIRYRTDYTVKEFANARTEPLTAEQSAELNAKLDSIDDIWGEIVDSSGDEVCYPHKRSTLKKSINIVASVVAQAPAQKDIVEKINSYNELINHARERQFSGSKGVIVISAVIALICGAIFNSFAVVGYATLVIFAYVLSSRTANFMLIVQLADKNNGETLSFINSFLTKLISGITTSKSSTTNSRDRWISIITAFVMTIVLSLLLPLIAIVNYTRNYLIYK